MDLTFERKERPVLVLALTRKKGRATLVLIIEREECPMLVPVTEMKERPMLVRMVTGKKECSMLVLLVIETTDRSERHQSWREDRAPDKTNTMCHR